MRKLCAWEPVYFLLSIYFDEWIEWLCPGPIQIIGLRVIIGVFVSVLPFHKLTNKLNLLKNLYSFQLKQLPFRSSNPARRVTAAPRCRRATTPAATPPTSPGRRGRTTQPQGRARGEANFVFLVNLNARWRQISVLELDSRWGLDTSASLKPCQCNWILLGFMKLCWNETHGRKVNLFYVYKNAASLMQLHTQNSLLKWVPEWLLYQPLFSVKDYPRDATKHKVWKHYFFTIISGPPGGTASTRQAASSASTSPGPSWQWRHCSSDSPWPGTGRGARSASVTSPTATSGLCGDHKSQDGSRQICERRIDTVNMKRVHCDPWNERLDQCAEESYGECLRSIKLIALKRRELYRHKKSSEKRKCSFSFKLTSTVKRESEVTAKRESEVYEISNRPANKWTEWRS